MTDKKYTPTFRMKKGFTNTVEKISEEGVLFRSYRDGRKVLLTPETSVGAQKAYRSGGRARVCLYVVVCVCAYACANVYRSSL